MNSWLVWLVFVIAFVMLGFVGYHFSVRTLRFFAAALGAAVIVIVTRYGITHPAPAAANLVNSFTRGFNDLSTALIQPLLPGHRIPAPGETGWLVIIVGLIFAYRELEVWAMHWEPPAIDTSALAGDQPGTQTSEASGEPDEGTTDSQRHTSLLAELRFRLPAVEVRAPAILPGGTKPNGLASIAENSGVSGSGLAGAIIRFAGMLWPNPRRYQVRVWIEHGHRPAGGEERGTRVTVDLEDSRTGGSIATRTLIVGDFGQAASVVAGYVAGHIFRTDPTTPPWCVGSFAGDDLAAMLIAGRQRVLTALPADTRVSRYAQINILEKCKLDSGVARYELAQLHDLAGDHVAALRLHAMNREDYHRFYRGRYRLGMSLEMIANPEFELRDEVAATDMVECLRVLDRCRVTRGPVGRYDDIMPGKLGRELRQELLAAAQDELRAVRQQLTLWRVTWAMFRHRDEREIRKPHWRLRERQSFHDGARVAELLIAVRQCLLEAEPGGRPRDRYGHHAKRALHIATAIAGDCHEIEALLKAAGRQQAPPSRPGWLPPRHATKTRWLPGQCRTPSWQAAYNLACLYAALAPSCADPGEDARANRDARAEQVVLSLTRVVNDRDCEMERPWDWISTDPDLSAVRLSPAFSGFLHRQEQRDYPVPGATIKRARG